MRSDKNALAREDALNGRAGAIHEEREHLIPEAAPFGKTFFDARERAIVAGSLVNNPSGG
jgi:hypothetical protein